MISPGGEDRKDRRNIAKICSLRRFAAYDCLIEIQNNKTTNRTMFENENYLDYYL